MIIKGSHRVLFNIAKRHGFNVVIDEDLHYYIISKKLENNDDIYFYININTANFDLFINYLSSACNVHVTI